MQVIPALHGLPHAEIPVLIEFTPVIQSLTESNFGWCDIHFVLMKADVKLFSKKAMIVFYVECSHPAKINAMKPSCTATAIIVSVTDVEVRVVLLTVQKLFASKIT